MWFWQRKEVYVGYRLEDFNRVRNLLAENRIDYDYRMNNRQRLDFDRNISGLGRMGYDRHDARFDTLYYIYVRKEDAERAARLLREHPFK